MCRGTWGCRVGVRRRELVVGGLVRGVGGAGTPVMMKLSPVLGCVPRRVRGGTFSRLKRALRKTTRTV